MGWSSESEEDGLTAGVAGASEQPEVEGPEVEGAEVEVGGVEGGGVEEDGVEGGVLWSLSSSL